MSSKQNSYYKKKHKKNTNTAFTNTITCLIRHLLLCICSFHYLVHSIVFSICTLLFARSYFIHSKLEQFYVALYFCIPAYLYMYMIFFTRFEERNWFASSFYIHGVVCVHSRNCQTLLYALVWFMHLTEKLIALLFNACYKRLRIKFKLTWLNSCRHQFNLA